MSSLKHSRKAEVETLRQIIKDADPGITEQIKWNAPSFCFDGEDRVTFRLQPKDRVELILHRGVKVKDAKHFQFDDPNGLVHWVTNDRGVITFVNLDDVTEKQAALQELVARWVLVK